MKRQTIQPLLNQFENASNKSDEQELLNYPTLKRASSLLTKFFWGILFAVDVVFTLIGFVGTAPFWIIGGLIIGAVYFIRSLREVYKENKKEKKLVKEVGRKIDNFSNRLIDVLDNGKIKDIQAIILALEEEQGKAAQEREHDVEAIYHHIRELAVTITKLEVFLTEKISYAKDNLVNKYQASKNKFIGVKSELKTLQDRADKLRPSSNQGKIKREHLVMHTAQKKPNEHESVLSKFWVFTKKSCNRLFSFSAHAIFMSTIVAAILGFLGITAIAAFLVSNPIGWAVLGAMFIMSAGGVLIDYTIMRKQKNKIRKLESMKQEYEIKELGLNHIQTSLNGIQDRLESRTNVKALSDKDEEISQLKSLLKSTNLECKPKQTTMKSVVNRYHLDSSVGIFKKINKNKLSNQNQVENNVTAFSNNEINQNTAFHH